MPALVDDDDDLFARFDDELPPTPEPQPCAPAAGAGDDMDTSNDRLMDGESPFDLEMDDEDDTMVSTLILAGANMNQARTYAAAVRGKTDAPTFMEYYGRGEIMKDANRARRCLNVKGIHALDLRTFRPDGTHWDFTKIRHRKDARRMVRELKPNWIIGSPHCTAFSRWNIGINYKKMSPTDVFKMLSEGRLHLLFMASIYREQLRCGRHFLHEHPASAMSWREECIDDLRKDSRVHEVVCDQCQFGQLKCGNDWGFVAANNGDVQLAMSCCRPCSGSTLGDTAGAEA